MSFILQNTITNERVGGKTGPIYFRTKAKAENFLKSSLTSSNYRIIKVTSPKEEEAEIKSVLYDKQIMDIYHAIETAKDEERLFQLAKLLQETLKNRRQTKRKLNPSSGQVSIYKNRTNILEKLEK